MKTHAATVMCTHLVASGGIKRLIYWSTRTSEGMGKDSKYLRLSKSIQKIPGIASVASMWDQPPIQRHPSHPPRYPRFSIVLEGAKRATHLCLRRFWDRSLMALLDAMSGPIPRHFGYTPGIPQISTDINGIPNIIQVIAPACPVTAQALAKKAVHCCTKSVGKTWSPPGGEPSPRMVWRFQP